MPRISRDGNLRKLCGCVKWKDCAHPYYLDYQEKGRGRYRPNLDKLIGHHPVDFAEAKAEARRAIVAWQEGRDVRRLQPSDVITLDALMGDYAERPAPGVTDAMNRATVSRAVVDGRPFGQWPVGRYVTEDGQRVWKPEITAAVLERFRATRPRVAGNRNLAYLRAMFNWAVLNRLAPSSPFRVGHVAAVRLAREEPRTRRLQAGEEERLLGAARGLADLVVAALETGCRLGELLSLQWWQVGADLALPAGKTKAKKPRRVPISSALRPVLDRRRLDPAGEPLPPDAYVFGDEVGRRRLTLKTAWRLTCVRAKITGLHFHDLRREAGSRWMDAGVPLSVIQRWLGHHNIAQTSTYLAATHGGDADAMRLFEEATGRLTYVDVFSSSKGNQGPRTDDGANEQTSKTAVLH